MTNVVQDYSWMLWGWVKKWMPLGRQNTAPEVQARLDDAFKKMLHPFTEKLYKNRDQITYVPHLLSSAMAEVEHALEKVQGKRGNVNFMAVSRNDSRIDEGGLSHASRGLGYTPKGMVPIALPERIIPDLEPLLLGLSPEPDEPLVLPSTTRIHVKGSGSRKAMTVSDVLSAGKLRAETAAKSAPSLETRNAGPRTEIGQSGIHTIKGSIDRMTSDGDGKAPMPRTNANKPMEAMPVRQRAKRAGSSSKSTFGDSDDETYHAKEKEGRGSTGVVKRKKILSDKEGVSDAEKGKQRDGEGSGVTDGAHALKKRKLYPASTKWSHPKEPAKDEDVKMESDSEPIIASSSSDKRCNACKKGDRPCSVMGAGVACGHCKKSKIRCSLVIREVQRKTKEPVTAKKNSRPVPKKNIRLQSITRSMSQTADVSPAVNAASKSDIAFAAMGAPHRLPPAVPVNFSPPVQLAPTLPSLPSTPQSTKATRPTVPKSKGGPKMEFAGVFVPVTKNGRREPERIAPAGEAFDGRQHKTTFLALNESPTPPPDIPHGADNSLILDAIKRLDEKVTGLMNVVDTIRVHNLEVKMAGPSHKTLEQAIMTSPKAISVAGTQTSPIHLSRSPSPIVGMNQKFRGSRRPSPALSASTAFAGDFSPSPSPPPPMNALTADNTNRNDLDTGKITEAVGGLRLAREDVVGHENAMIIGKDVDMTVEKFQVGTGTLCGMVDCDDDDDVSGDEDMVTSAMDEEHDIGKESMEGVFDGQGSVIHADPQEDDVGKTIMDEVLHQQGSVDHADSQEDHVGKTVMNEVLHQLGSVVHADPRSNHAGFSPEKHFLPTDDVKQLGTHDEMHAGEQLLAEFTTKKEPGVASTPAKSRGSSSSSLSEFSKYTNREAMASSPIPQPTDATSDQPHEVHNEDVAVDAEEDYDVDHGEDVEEDRDNMKIEGPMASPGYPPDGASAHILPAAVDPTLLFGTGENLLG